MKNKTYEKKILAEIERALSMQFCGSYTWTDMINDTDLTFEEKKWAIKNTGFAVVCSEK